MPLIYNTKPQAVKSDTSSKAKTQEKVKSNKKSDRIYYIAESKHPGAVVYINQPISSEYAKLRLNLGGDVWAKDAFEAEQLCLEIGGGFTGPTRDSNPLNAMHYHPLSYVARGHVFFGEEDPNLTFVTLFD